MRAHAAAVDAPAGGERLAADEDVLLDREVREEDRLLVDDRDAGVPGTCRAVEEHLVPVDEDRARVGLMHAGQNLDERRLARAVLTEKRMSLPGSQLDGHVLEGTDRSERLRSALERQHGHRLGRPAQASILSSSRGDLEISSNRSRASRHSSSSMGSSIVGANETRTT